MKKPPCEVRLRVLFVYSDGRQCRLLPPLQVPVLRSITSANSITFAKSTRPPTIFPNMSPTTLFPLQPSTVPSVASLPPLPTAAFLPKLPRSLSISIHTPGPIVQTEDILG